MKIKKIIIISAAVLLFIALAFTLFHCYVNGVFDSPKPRNIYTRALLSKNILELPVKGIRPNAPDYFNIELSINEIYEKIKDEQSLSVELVDEKIFIIKDNNDGTKDYFIIEALTEVGDKSYHFFDMGGTIDNINDLPADEDNRQTILIPYHLTNDKNLNNFSKSVDIEKEYKTKYGVEKFYDFYNNSGWYEVEKGEDYIIIKGYVDEDKVLDANSAVRFPFRDLDFKKPLKIQFRSSKEPNENLFKFVIAE